MGAGGRGWLCNRNQTVLLVTGSHCSLQKSSNPGFLWWGGRSMCTCEVFLLKSTGENWQETFSQLVSSQATSRPELEVDLPVHSWQYKELGVLETRTEQETQGLESWAFEARTSKSWLKAEVDLERWAGNSEEKEGSSHKETGGPGLLPLILHLPEHAPSWKYLTEWEAPPVKVGEANKILKVCSQNNKILTF
jgi:hypothetical protein